MYRQNVNNLIDLASDLGSGDPSGRVLKQLTHSFILCKLLEIIFKFLMSDSDEEGEKLVSDGRTGKDLSSFLARVGEIGKLAFL